MKKRTRLILGGFTWIVLGLLSIGIDWRMFIVWVISAYVYYILIEEPYRELK